MAKKRFVIIVHNIRSAYNVGSILRTADGAGANKVYLSGYAPAPYKSGDRPYKTQPQKMLEKTSLGAENFVNWEKIESISELIGGLRQKGFQIIALEQNEKSVDFQKAEYKFPCALILGNEVGGIEQKILDDCDLIISIPMRGKKESLNVSVAAGIAAYEILK